LGIEGEFLGEPHVFLSCDNAWVELMVETGFGGLLIIALTLLKPALVAWRQYQRFPVPERQLSLFLLVNMIIYYFQMYTVAMYSWGQNGYMLWVLIALTFAHGKCRERKAELSASQSRSFSPVELEAELQTT
jgi:O-antigen ligase